MELKYPCLKRTISFFFLVGPILLGLPASASGGIDRYNFILGTQTFGIKYSFTDKGKLLETAEEILKLGSNVIKFHLGKGCERQYGFRLRGKIHSLTELVQKEDQIRKVLDMPFYYYVLWVYCYSPINWRQGISENQKKKLYEEFKEFCDFLMERYKGTGKTFLLGHWEGDWSLLGEFDRRKTPSEEAIKGMIQWLRIRQRAVDEARKQHKDSDVRLYNYSEVNLVWKAMEGKKTVANSVLPKVPLDYVSYSSWDSLGKDPEKMEKRLISALDFLKKKIHRKREVTFLPGKRVFIGEYGFPLIRVGTPSKQAELSRVVAQTAIRWGCPFALYWEIYCNETEGGKHRGFWMIDDKGRKQPVYYLHKRYYRRSRLFLKAYKRRYGSLPSDEAFRKEALNWLRP